MIIIQFKSTYIESTRQNFNRTYMQQLLFETQNIFKALKISENQIC